MFFKAALTMVLLIISARDVFANECREHSLLDEPLCSISMIRLIANPERFDGKMVRFNAVVRLIEDGPVELYYSQESFLRQSSIEAVEISSALREVNRPGIRGGSNS